MSLIEDESPSCPICEDSCIGFVHQTKPMSFLSLVEQGNDAMVQEHQEDVSDGEEVDQEAVNDEENEQRIIARRGRRPGRDRARHPAADRAHHPEDDR